MKSLRRRVIHQRRPLPTPRKWSGKQLTNNGWMRLPIMSLISISMMMIKNQSVILPTSKTLELVKSHLLLNKHLLNGTTPGVIATEVEMVTLRKPMTSGIWVTKAILLNNFMVLLENQELPLLIKMMLNQRDTLWAFQLLRFTVIIKNIITITKMCLPTITYKTDGTTMDSGGTMEMPVDLKRLTPSGTWATTAKTPLTLIIEHQETYGLEAWTKTMPPLVAMLTGRLIFKLVSNKFHILWLNLNLNTVLMIMEIGGPAVTLINLKRLTLSGIWDTIASRPTTSIIEPRGMSGLQVTVMATQSQKVIPMVKQPSKLTQLKPMLTTGNS